jgi:integrase
MNIKPISEDKFKLIVEAGYDGKGKRIRKTRTVTVPKTLLKAPKKLESYLESEYYKFKTEVEAGAYISPEKTLFKDFVPIWEKKYARKHLDGKTQETYQYILDKDILPVLGHKKIDEIKPIHIIDFLDDYEEENEVSSSSIHVRYRILRDILGKANDWKIISENPVESVKRPKQEYEEYEVYSEEEVPAVIDALEGELEHYKLMVKIALAGGLRRGEMLALFDTDFDFTNNTVEINKSLQYTKQKGYQLKEPKNKHSFRTISLPQSLMDEIKIYIRNLKKERMRFADRWIYKDPYLFVSDETGKPFYPTSANTWFKRFTNRKGLKQLRFHDLRHTHATLLINQIGKVPGLNIKSISRRLGHANVQTTLNIYVHSNMETDILAAESIGNVFEKTLEKHA